MKSLFKTTIGVLAISLASVSVSQADTNRHSRDYDRTDNHYAKKFDRRDHNQHNYRDHHNYRGNHLKGHPVHPRSTHAGWKRHYWEHKRFRAIKQMKREKALRHELRHRHFSRNYGQVNYVAPVAVVPAPRVTYRTHVQTHNAIPVIAGGIIGSSIANNVSHGDPAATIGGAIFGAVIGDAISRH